MYDICLFSLVCYAPFFGARTKKSCLFRVVDQHLNLVITASESANKLAFSQSEKAARKRDEYHNFQRHLHRGL